MRIICVAILSVFYAGLFSQPVYEASSYGGVGSEIVYSGAAIDSVLVNMQLVLEGENQSWDFSGLEIIDQFRVAPEDKAESGYQLGFITTCSAQGVSFLDCNAIWNNDVDYAIPVDANLGDFGDFGGQEFAAEEIKIFRKLEDNLLTEAILGLTVNAGQSIRLGFAYNEYDTIYQFPIEYGKQFSHPSSYDLDFTSFGAPFAYFHHQVRSSEVDGYGNLITPYGTFEDCLRMTTTIEYADTIVLQGQRLPIPRTEIVYEWFQNNYEAPVMEVRASLTPLPGPLRITSVQFFDSLRCFTPMPAFQPDALTKELEDGEAVFQFSNQSTLGEQFEWDFGDGNTSNENSPSHSYTAAGEYTVTLTVCNEVCDPVRCEELSLNVVVTEEITSTVENLSKSMKLLYHQNDGMLQLEFPENKGEYELIDASGKTLRKAEVNDFTTQISVSNLSNGFFVVKWTSETAVATKSWVKY